MSFLKKIINLDIILCAVFVFGILWILSKANFKTDLIDPIGEALGDFELTDLVYTALRDNPKCDTNITMVNIGNLNRGELGQVIMNLNQYNPKVIGIDAFYRKDKTQYYLENGLVNGDSILELALSQTNNLVLVTKLANFNEKTGLFDTLETSHPKFMQHAEGGFANMVTSEKEFRVSRKIVPLDLVNDNVKLFFPIKIASIYAPEKVEKFLKRKKAQDLLKLKQKKAPISDGVKYLETIYYRGNINNFSSTSDLDAFGSLDALDVLNNYIDPKLVTGKILMLGYMGETLKNDKFWDEDKFYTPLNKKFAGKSFPDMYGVTVHANVISMALNETYVEILDENLNLYINIFICILNVILFAYVHNYIKLWWDGISVVITFAEWILLIFISLILFEYKRVEIRFDFVYIFLFLLGNLLELYYEYAKPGIYWATKKTLKLVGKK